MTHEQIINRISDKTRLIGISNLFSFAFPAVKDLIDEIKSTFPDIPVVLCEAHYIYDPWVNLLMKRLLNLYLEISRTVSPDGIVNLIEMVVDFAVLNIQK